MTEACRTFGVSRTTYYRWAGRAQRVAALAQLTAATTGILTTAAKDGPFGFCQLTAVDTATRYAVASLVAGDKSARDAAAFVDHVAERLAGIGAELTGVLSDNGPEFISKTFTEHLDVRGVRHHRIPPRSPNHNAVGERFQGTALQEFSRPAFHRQHFARLTDLNAQFQGWLQHCNLSGRQMQECHRCHPAPLTLTRVRPPATHRPIFESASCWLR